MRQIIINDWSRLIEFENVRGVFRHQSVSLNTQQARTRLTGRQKSAGLTRNKRDMLSSIGRPFIAKSDAEPAADLFNRSAKESVNFIGSVFKPIQPHDI